MIGAAFERLVNWWRMKAWPSMRVWTRETAGRWWAHFGDDPASHTVSMVVGIALYFVVKLAVWMAA
jgi:hypothetical protein